MNKFAIGVIVGALLAFGGLQAYDLQKPLRDQPFFEAMRKIDEIVLRQCSEHTGVSFYGISLTSTEDCVRQIQGELAMKRLHNYATVHGFSDE